MDNKSQWDNLTKKDHKGNVTYGLHSKTAVSFIKTHQVHHSPSMDYSKSLIFITFSTFDSEFVLIENQFESGKFEGNQLSFKEKLKIKTHVPIANCWLQHQYNNISCKDYLIGFLIDIFSNIYTFNFSTYFQYNAKTTFLQPIKYTTIHLNYTNRPLSNIHLEHPLLFSKHQNIITTFNHGGTLKVFDLSQDKSWITTHIEPEVYQFKAIGLAGACSNAKNSLGNVVAIVLNNRQIPYVFVDCKSANQYHESNKFLDEFYSKWKQETSEITFCQFDPVTNLIAVSLITQEIELYEIKKSREDPKGFYYCQQTYRFFPLGSTFDIKSHIEHLSAAKGYLAITTCEQYIVMSLSDQTIKRRGKGAKVQNKIQKLKWTLVLDTQKNFIAIMLAKGYNHHNESQSKVDKPNLHFKTLDLNKDSKNR